jgi:MFS family permease
MEHQEKEPAESGTSPDVLTKGEADSFAMRTKWRQVALLSFAELLAMTLWFSASAVVPQLTELWHLTSAQRSWVTMSVQLGFVAGAILSAVLNLPARMSSRTLFGICAILGAVANAAIPLLAASFYPALVLRFLTGALLAGVYPPGMKLVATWCKDDRGVGIGILVGALTAGSAFPHLLSGLPFLGNNGLPSWRFLMLITSGQAIAAGLMVLFWFRSGPYLMAAAPFDWRFAGKLLTDKPTRLANLGYLGHMWELFAMWTWLPLLLLESYEQAGWNVRAARFSGFAVIAIGAIGCVIAGKLADRLGRTTVTIGSLIASGSCAIIAGFLISSPLALTALSLVWGFTIVADSAQFSAAVSELTNPKYVGTALTVQTSLGFLLTLVTIQIVPEISDAIGWQYALPTLALGPLVGIIGMYRLRQLPEAVRMAQGRR